MGRRILELFSAAVLLVGLVAAVLLCKRLVDKEREQLRANSEAEAQHVATQLRAGVLQNIDALNDVAKWWVSQGRPFDVEDWHKDGQLFLARSPGLHHAIWIGSNGLQHWSAVVGSDPAPRIPPLDPRLLGALTAARSIRGVALSEIFET